MKTRQELQDELNRNSMMLGGLLLQFLAEANLVYTRWQELDREARELDDEPKEDGVK